MSAARPPNVPPNVPSGGDLRLEVKGIGDDDRVVYSKADAMKACRIGLSFAFSFYQFDYNALANAASGTSTLKPDQVKLLPVAKIVMDPEGFVRFKAELDQLVLLMEQANQSPAL